MAMFPDKAPRPSSKSKLGILKPLSLASPVNLKRAADDEGVVREEISNFSILVRQYSGES